MKLVCHYSGNKSKRFWDAVNKLPRNEGGETAYMLGVVLQEVEARVLGFLEKHQQKIGAEHSKRFAKSKK